MQRTNHANIGYVFPLITLDRTHLINILLRALNNRTVKFELELFCASQKRYVLIDEKFQKYVSKPQNIVILADCYVGPIVNYGSEKKGFKCWKKIHLEFFVNILGVEKSA